VSTTNDDEIQAAECVIVAVDRSIPLARFVGKRLVYASAGDAVRDADRLLEKAVSGKAPVYRGGHAFRTSDWKELGREYYGHLMSGISHMLALSLLLQHLFGRSDITTMMTNVGNAAFRMMYPVLAAFIAYSIADRPGFMPGLMGGYLAQLGTTTAPRLGWISSGFWGAIVAGFAAGLAVRLLNYLFRRIPQELDHIKTGLLVPLLSLLFVGALMVMAINPPLGRFNAWLSIQLDGMQGGSRLVLGTLLGGAYEYLCSVFTEVVFGAVFWDYSAIPFNLGGRINLLYCFFWGFAAIAWFKVLFPPISACIEKLPPRGGRVLTWALCIFMAADIAVSSAALVRYNDRLNGVPASNSVEVYLDGHYGNDRMNQVYPKAVHTS
jgi:hypothetical protein